MATSHTPAESRSASPPKASPCPGFQESTDKLLAGRRVLVIDDDEICGDLARFILEHQGCLVDVAETPHSASIRMMEHKPDVVLMDVHLGSANGIKLIESIRRGNRCPDVPVIVVTADHDRYTFSEAIGILIQGYVLKPYDAHFLIDKVAEVLNRTQTSRS